MAIDWDPDKAKSNRSKHGISFADVVGVFEDDTALTIPDEHPDEDRYITVGQDFLGRVVVVVFTWRGDDIRIISARKATRQERIQYARG